MKITGYRKVFSEGGVTVAERVEAEITFQTLVARSLVPLDAMPPLGVHTATVDCRAPDNNERRAASPIAFSDGGGERQVDGVLFWSSLTGMMNFLLDRYVAERDCAFDGLVKAAREGESGARIELEAALTEGNGYRKTSSRYKHSLAAEPPVRCVKLDDFFGEGGKRVVLTTGEHYFCTYTGESRMSFGEGRGTVLVARPASRRLRGRDIPRLAFLAPMGDWLVDADEQTDAGYLLFDGESHRWLRSLEDLPPADVDAFETHGAVLSKPSFDIFPCPHLRTRCLIRIPGRSEMEAFVQAHPSPRKPTRQELSRPALVRDSREPVALGRAPLLTSPGAAFFVLSRLVRGVFLPSDAFHPFPLGRLAETESYMVLCEPQGPM